MKVIQIINSLNTGGAEKLLLETIPLYIEKGIKMDILLLWDDDCMFTKKLKELACCNIYILNQSNSAKFIYSPLNIFKISRIIKNYDLAHVHLFPAQYFSVFANMLTGNKCKLIFTEHNTTNRRITNSWFKFIEKIIYSRYSKLVCITDEIKQIYKKYLSLEDKKITTINNGVYLEGIFKASPIKRKELNKSLRNSDILIVQVSAFRPQKDQKTLIRALLNLDNKFKLLLIGDGVTLNENKSLVRELKLNDRVLFLGQRNDINRILKSVDIVVLSSFYEGLSLSSIEGMASGNPFVASNVPGLREVVKDAGVLFEQGNSEQLAKEILKLLNNKDYYTKTVAACIKRAKEFDISIMVNKHIKLYNEIQDKTY